MGYGAAFDLVHNSPEVQRVTLADFDAAKAEEAAGRIGTSSIEARQVDASNFTDVVDLMRGHDAVISCVNYWYNESLSRAAIDTGASFCDLGGITMWSMPNSPSTQSKGGRDQYHSRLRACPRNGLGPRNARRRKIRPAR
jgi:hypothetical protein